MSVRTVQTSACARAGLGNGDYCGSPNVRGVKCWCWGGVDPDADARFLIFTYEGHGGFGDVLRRGRTRRDRLVVVG